MLLEQHTINDAIGKQRYEDGSYQFGREWQTETAFEMLLISLLRKIRFLGNENGVII